MVSIVGIGALTSRVCCSQLADRLGQRSALLTTDALIVVALGLQSTTQRVELFFLARFLLGMGLGLAFVVTPTYLCEIAPKKHRGFFICLNEVAVCVGCLLGLHVSSHDTSDWRWQQVVALAAVPAGLQLAFVLCLPESPRWYALRGDVERMQRSLKALGLESETIELKGLAAKGKDLELDNGCDQRAQWVLHRRPLCLSLGVAGFTAAVGSIAVQAYAKDLLKLCHVEEPASVLPWIGWTKLAGALIAMTFSDSPRVGRRRLIIAGALLCMLCDVMLLTHLALPGRIGSAVAATCVVLRIFGWTAGCGGVQFLVISELLPSAVRSSFSGQVQAFASIIDVLLLQVRAIELSFLEALYALNLSKHYYRMSSDVHVFFL